MAPTHYEKVSNYIPEDLAFIILSKLPVKSLKRFRCVHKSWADLSANPHFMTMYRHNFISKDDNSSLLLKLNLTSTFRNNLFLFSGERFEKSIKLDWPPPFQEDDYILFLSGSSINGIICLYQNPFPPEIMQQKIALWNPATQECKVIPFSPIEYPLGLEICLDIHGFGYDPVRNDYKVIRYVYFLDDLFRPVAYVEDIPDPFWEIYSLKSNSWRKLNVKMANRRHPAHFEVYLNGECHWWGLEGPNQEKVLVSFNMSNEVFHTTPLDLHDRYEVLYRNLVVLNGSIAMITHYVGAIFDISILGEIGVKESWTKLFTFGPLPCFRHSIGVGKKGNIFFIKYDDDDVASFDLGTQMIVDIGVKGVAYCCQIVLYKESLLPIGGINH